MSSATRQYLFSLFPLQTTNNSYRFSFFQLTIFLEQVSIHQFALLNYKVVSHSIKNYFFDLGNMFCFGVFFHVLFM